MTTIGGSSTEPCADAILELGSLRARVIPALSGVLYIVVHGKASASSYQQSYLSVCAYVEVVDGNTISMLARVLEGDTAGGVRQAGFEDTFVV